MRRKTVTWKEIKKAVSEAGVGEDEEIILIQCENEEGDHTFQKVRFAKTLKLAENTSTHKTGKEANGCAV
jgi:hypothetical protein